MKLPESLQNLVDYNILTISCLQTMGNSVIFDIISLFNLFLSNKYIAMYLIIRRLRFLYIKTGRICNYKNNTQILPEKDRNI